MPKIKAISADISLLSQHSQLQQDIKRDILMISLHFWSYSIFFVLFFTIRRNNSIRPGPLLFCLSPAACFIMHRLTGLQCVATVIIFEHDSLKAALICYHTATIYLWSRNNNWIETDNLLDYYNLYFAHGDTRKTNTYRDKKPYFIDPI